MLNRLFRRCFAWRVRRVSKGRWRGSETEGNHLDAFSYAYARAKLEAMPNLNEMSDDERALHFAILRLEGTTEWSRRFG